MNTEQLKSPIGIIAIMGVIGTGYFGFSYASHQQKADTLTNQLFQANRLMKDGRKANKEIETSGIDANASKSKIWSTFNTQLQQVTAKHGIKLSEIQIDATAKPLVGLSRPKPGAARKASGPQWGTHSVTFAFQGSTPQVYSALKAMASIEPAFKITKISFSKSVAQGNPATATGAPGIANPATLVANIQVALLTPSGGI
jgi:hypothetical protein